jgi:hypothetical protein
LVPEQEQQGDRKKRENGEKDQGEKKSMKRIEKRGMRKAKVH